MLQGSSVWTEIDPRYTCDGNGAWRGLHVCILSFLSLSSSSHSLFLSLSLSLSHKDTSFQPCSQNIYARVSLHAYSFYNASPIANNKRWGEHWSHYVLMSIMFITKSSSISFEHQTTIRGRQRSDWHAICLFTCTT